MESTVEDWCAKDAVLYLKYDASEENVGHLIGSFINRIYGGWLVAATRGWFFCRVRVSFRVHIKYDIFSVEHEMYR